MRLFDIITAILLILGGLNWGLVALGINPIEMMWGAGTILTRCIYGIVGLAAIYRIVQCKAIKERCKGSK